MRHLIMGAAVAAICIVVLAICLITASEARASVSGKTPVGPLVRGDAMMSFPLM